MLHCYSSAFVTSRSRPFYNSIQHTILLLWLWTCLQSTPSCHVDERGIFALYCTTFLGKTTGVSTIHYCTTKRPFFFQGDR
jgi:hypothetical protein